MVLKKIGYHIVKGKCVKVYSMRKKNRAGRFVVKKVNYRGKAIRKGTKIYKTKASCLKALKRKMNKNRRTVKKRSHSRKKTYKFGNSCYSALQYGGSAVPFAKQGITGTGIYAYDNSWKFPRGATQKTLMLKQN